MKIAFCIRKDYLDRKGGDTIQLLSTKEALERIFSIQSIVITDVESIKDSDADIFHVFNLSDPHNSIQFVTECKRYHKKVALSTIYWDLSYSTSAELLDLLTIVPWNSKIILWIRSLLNLTGKWIGKPKFSSGNFKKAVTMMVAAADTLLPNSPEELALISTFIGFEKEVLLQKTTVVVNATAFNLNVSSGVRPDLPENYVLQVGRIEATKNQLGVIKALFNEKDIPIVFVGNTKFRPSYYQKVKQLAEQRGNVFFIEEIEHQQLPAIYQRAIVHVLASFRESPGLVSLEALANKCKAVVSSTAFCPVTFYFGDDVTIVNPLDTDSIRAGILTEIDTKRDMEFISTRIREKFSWDKAAQQTYSSYQGITKLK
ncbi:MAG: glycosyltransferase [Bacteroidota bacterium]